MKFAEVLVALGFCKSSPDHTLFTRSHNQIDMAILVYVDDIIVASSCDSAVLQLKQDLARAFKFRDLGQLRYFLGLEVARNPDGIMLCQHKYTLELLQHTSLLGCKATSAPMDPNVKLSKDDGDLLPDAELYRSLIGKLMYLTFTRPYITYVVHKLCQFNAVPRLPHLRAAYKVIHYLKGTVDQGLFYSATTDLKLTGFADSDWASCPDTRRSVSGFHMFIGTSLVSWKSNKQTTVSRSSAEAEYRSLALAVYEMIWLRRLMQDLWINTTEASSLFCDSTAALHISNNPVYHERTKHIEIDCHTIREKIEFGMIKTLHVRTDNQLADLLTKLLFPTQFRSLLSKMDIVNILAPS